MIRPTFIPSCSEGSDSSSQDGRLSMSDYNWDDDSDDSDEATSPDEFEASSME